MPSPRINIWKYDHAPLELRGLHTSGVPAEWIMHIPRVLASGDVLAEIRRIASLHCVFEYVAQNGDIVLAGAASVDQMIPLLVVLDRDDESTEAS